MKKTLKNLFFLMVMTALCVVMAMTATALETFTYGDYMYYIQDGEAAIIQYTGTDEVVTIPAEIDGLKVSKIDGIAQNQSIKKVIISEGIREIIYSFDSCYNLEEIYLPESVSLFEVDDWNGWFGLKRFVVDEDNPYYCNDEYGVLYNKDKTVLVCYPVNSDMKSYIIPDTVETIGFYAMSFSLNLEELTLPESVKNIEEGGIAGNLRLEKVNLSFSGSLPDIVFSCDYSLKEATLNNVNEISGSIFEACYSLDDIIIKDMDTVFTENAALALVDGTFNDESDRDEFVHYSILYLIADFCEDYEELERLTPYYEQACEKFIPLDEYTTLATIHCHSGSTAETFAIENGLTYELTHFFEGEWTYDYEQMIRWRKCIHCDELEIEPLEKTENDGTEIIAPENPELDFDVDNIESTGDDFILVEEDVKNALGEEWTLLKAFDITLKNKDGVHVQPDGTVKVKLPLDWEKDGNYKVYRVNDDGTLTDMNAYRQGSHMVFDTDHFSVYVIVEEGTQEIPDDTPTEEEKSPFDFFTKIIEWFKQLINTVTEFFRSIGDRT